VLTEVQDEIPAGDLAIKGSVVIETVIPVHLKAQIPHVKLVRLREIEDSQDWDHSLKCDCLRHCASDFAQACCIAAGMPTLLSVAVSEDHSPRRD
jgi:hypothetical protein